MQAAFKTAQSLLWAPCGLDESHGKKALSLIMKAGADDADLYFQYTRNESWHLEEGIVKSGQFSIDQGVGVRAIQDEKTALAYTDDIRENTLMDAARAVREIAQHRVHNQKRFKVAKVAASPSQEARLLYAPIDPLTTLDSQAKVALLEKVERLAKAHDPRVVQVMASLSCEYEAVLIMRADGLVAADIRPLSRLSISVIVQHKDRRESASSGGGGRLGLEMFDEQWVAHHVKEAVEAALLNLEARSVAAGEFPVVLGPGWPGVLLHEAVGHGLEGDFNRKGSSAFSGKIGQRVAAKGITVVDDGTLPHRRGSLNIDDEGTATQCNVLIEDGILKGYIHDRLNARLMGVAPTGNGRRESYAHLVMPRMTNTYMLAGQQDPQEIIASIDKGVYATHFGGGQVDITSGKFVFSASSAWWVEKGRLLYPVKGATLIGNGPDILTQVSMIGNDLQLDSGVGVCGKEGQSVPVGVGQPTLRIDRMTVGGTA